MFAITVSEKGGESKRMEFDKPEVTIGRVQGNDIILPKGNVSKRHSRIVLKDGKFIIVDLKSTNGTYVNGRKITSPLVVKGTDKIYIGDFILALEEGAEAGAEAEEPPPPPPRKQPTLPPPPPPRRSMPTPAPVEASEPETGDAPEVGERQEEVEPRRAAPQRPTVREEEHDEQTPVPRGTPERAPPRVTEPPARAPSIATPAVSPARLREAGGRRSLTDAKRAKLGQIIRELCDRLVSTLNFDESKGADEMLLSRAETTALKWTESLETEGELPVGVDARSLARDVAQEALALGPLGELLDDAGVKEIIIAGADRITVVRDGHASTHGKVFSSAVGLERVATRLLKRSGLTLRGNTVDGRLENGMAVSCSRFGSHGLTLLLHRPQRASQQLNDLATEGWMSTEMADFLRMAAQERRNIFVAGPVGSGRTTVLAAIAHAGKPGERVVCIEEAEEIDPAEGLWIPLVTGGDADGAVSYGLRQHADRVIVGDIRGGEALAVLCASSAGPMGLLAGLASSSSQDTLHHLESLGRLGPGSPSADVVRDLVSRGVDVLVQLGRLPTGETRVFEVAVVSGQGGAPTTSTIFSFKPDSGRFSASGKQPDWASAGAGVAMRR